MFRILARSARTGVVTGKQPLGSGACELPLLDISRCTACGECAAVCPTAALTVATDADTRVVSLAYGACIGCGDCVDVCGEDALRPGRGEVVAYTRAQLVRRSRFRAEAADRMVFVSDEAVSGPSLEDSAAALRARIRGRLGRSLHVRQVDAGSCNACELEIAATANPVYDLERFGIQFVASPRHADVLLVTGPVTRNMELALLRTLEATPEPRLVVAVGACGCTGGLFGEGTYAAVGGVDRVVPVDVYVPGCPPSPRAILAGLLTAMGIREARAQPLA